MVRIFPVLVPDASQIIFAIGMLEFDFGHQQNVMLVCKRSMQAIPAIAGLFQMDLQILFPSPFAPQAATGGPEVTNWGGQRRHNDIVLLLLRIQIIN